MILLYGFIGLLIFCIFSSICWWFTCFGFKEDIRRCQYGMSLDEIKAIMKNYDVDQSGYNRRYDYVLRYKVKRLLSSDFESVTFTFEGPYLADIATGYHRTYVHTI